MKTNNFICQKELGLVYLETEPFNRGCRYHRKQGSCYGSGEFIPKGFCPYAYAKIYPTALSFLYSQKERKEMITCPNENIKIKFLLSSSYVMPHILRNIKTTTLSLLNKIGIATEFPDKKILIEVVSSDKKCPKKLNTGKKFSFNLWSQKELCPASFYAMYPLYRNRTTTNFHCPDPEGVGYKANNESFNCKQIVSRYKMKNILCPLLIYSLYPYYLTFKDGGKFEWLLPGKNVRVQCPNCQGVITEVKWESKKNAINVKIVDVKNPCYWNILKNTEYELSAKDFNEINKIL